MDLCGSAGGLKTAPAATRVREKIKTGPPVGKQWSCAKTKKTSVVNDRFDLFLSFLRYTRIYNICTDVLLIY